MNLSRFSRVFLAAVLPLLFSILLGVGPAVGRRLVADIQPAGPAPADVPEQRVLTLDFPSFIRSGDSDLVRLTFQVDGSGRLAPTAPATAGTPNVFDTYTVLAEARLDMAGADVNPPNTVSQPLLLGQNATFFWRVSPREVGPLHGTVWFYLHYLPKNGGPDTRLALSAQPIDIETNSLFGIQAGPARWLGVVTLFLGALLGIPFAERALQWLWQRARR